MKVGSTSSGGRPSPRNKLKSLVPEGARVYCYVDERVEAGDPYHEILRVAAQRGSTLIVMGAHGIGVVERFFVGSTTERVVRQAGCPVLAVRNAYQERLPS